MTTDQQEIAARIRQLRKAKDVKQYELAQRIGITRPHMCQLENAQFGVTLDIARRLARELGVTLDHLVNGEVQL